MLAHWSSGIYRSTPHFVQHSSNQNYRVSVPFFFEPDFDSHVRPLESKLLASVREEKLSERRLFGSDDIIYGEWLENKVASNFDL